MRLIEADKLITDIRKEYGYFEAIEEIVRVQPAAYDPDAVVQQLEDLRDGVIEMLCCPYTEDDEMSCERCYMDKAIEIVKGGGQL